MEFRTTEIFFYQSPSANLSLLSFSLPAQARRCEIKAELMLISVECDTIKGLNKINPDSEEK